MKDSKNRYISACLAAAPTISNFLIKLPPELSEKAQEIRLRLNRPVAICGNDFTTYITQNGAFTNEIADIPLLKATQNDMNDTFKNICNFSVYSRQNEIKNGFITMQGGHRAGICGTAVLSNGEIVNIRDISTISIRIAREFLGCSKNLLEMTTTNFSGLLICGAPCSGKTTVLRDIARELSLQKNNRVSVIDSRGEIAATANGLFQNDIGMCDILDGYPKDKGIMQAIRSLSPDYIICDEIGSAEDLKAIEQSVNSGVKLIATIHAASYAELLKKQFGKKLLKTGVFENIVFLDSRENAGKIKEVINCGDITDA